MSEALISALEFVASAIDRATVAATDEDMDGAVEAIRDAEARLRMLAAEVRT